MISSLTRIAMALENIHAALVQKNERSARAKAAKVAVLTEADLDPVYAKWPKKQGKSAGYAKLLSTLKSREDLELFKSALDNALTTFDEEGREIRYYPMFSTFVSSWRDYLSDEAVAGAAQPVDSEEDLLELFRR
jgi:hypothetical protein